MKNLVLTALFLGFALVVGILVWNTFGALVTGNPTLSRIGEAIGAPQAGSTNFILDTDAQIDAALGQGGTPPIVPQEALEPFSPFFGKVAIVRNRDGISGLYDTPTEYITLFASPTNTEPVVISGWTLESMVSENSAVIPDGTELFILGEAPVLVPITLSPGEYAVITTNPSSFGTSFRTNSCTGFLDTFAPLSPRIMHECVEPSLAMPPTLENIKTYGESCVDFAMRFPACTYITDKTPGVDSLPELCHAHLQKTFTYNACIQTLKDTPSFNTEREWRVYLGGTRRLWKETYEAIRLSDENGMTVDVFAY